MLEIQATVQDSQLAQQWEGFFLDYVHEDLQAAAMAWPDVRSVYADFQDLQRNNPDLANYLLQRPQHALRVGRAVLYQLDVTVEPKPRLFFRVRGFPEAEQLLPRQLRGEHLGRLVVVQGIVMTKTKVWKRPIDAAFECKACGNLIHSVQTEDHLQEPPMCDACEKSGNIWKFREDMTRWQDVQYVTIQEPPDAIRGGSVPEAVSVELTDDLVHDVEVGDHVVFNGILAVKRRRMGAQTRIDFDNVLIALSFERMDHGYADTEIDPELEARFQDLAKRPDVYELLASCYMPSIAGMTDAKAAILYALAGAPTEVLDDGKRQRGEIHILLAGDPGIAKSALVEALDKYAPRVVHVDGTGASGAGVAAAVDHDPIDRSWVLRAGALVQADDGVCAFDEFGYMDAEDMGHLNTAMESGYVLQVKVVKAKMRAQATVIAAMNPTIGERFDRYGNAPIEQLGLPSALISRFDLILCFVDRVNEDQDRHVARAILRPAKSQDVELTADEFRRYVAWIRRIEPQLDDSALQILEDTYTQLRKTGQEYATVTGRQLQALRRLTLASARIRASSVATEEDAQRAVDLMMHALRTCGIVDANGVVDGDLLQFAAPRAQQDRQRILVQIIKDLCRQHPKGYLQGVARHKDILDQAEDQGISRDDAENGITQLRTRNTIYQRGGPGEWAVVSS